MKASFYSLIAVTLLAVSCANDNSFSGFKLSDSDSAIVSAVDAFNGYTNHWQNEYWKDYRFGGIFKYSTPDLDKAYRWRLIELASDLGMPGLQMQEGFINGILSSDNPEIVYADIDSDLGRSLSAKAPKFAQIGDYQSKAPDYSEIKAFILKKGSRSVYAVVGTPAMMDRFKAVVANARAVIDKYDMKRGWFGAETQQQSVTCMYGDQLELIGKGMNEGNSWFVLSGPYEFTSQMDTRKWIEEVGNPVVVDHGYSPLYGSDDYSSLQVQIMSSREDWLAFQKEHGGYMSGSLPWDTIIPEEDAPDFYMAHTGIITQLNRIGKPFAVRTGDLLSGTRDCMVLFTAKGEEFNRAKMWEAILGCRAVAILDGDKITGPDEFRKTLELLAIDRTYIEDYFAEKVSMLAHLDGHKLVVDITNFHKYAVDGTVSLVLPVQIAAGQKAQETVKVPAGASRQVVLDIDPMAEAMGRKNAVMASFDWGKGSKLAMASCDLPPAVSVHQLLYGTESECKFPVGIHNITHDSSVIVDLAVLDSNNGGNVVYNEQKTVDVENGTYAAIDFDLRLPEGAYTVKTTAMGIEALTQLGIGADVGNVTLREVDLNGDGINEYELENSKVKVTLLATGARIIEYNVKGVDDNVFFKLWPEQPCDMNRPNREWGFWPYGGFEDFLGQGSIETHKVYDAEITRNDGKCAEVTMTANYYGNILRKTYTLYGDTNLVGVRFALDFVNPELNVIGPQPILVLGKTHGVEDKFIIPELDGLNTYVMNPKEMYGRVMHLREGWNAGYDTKENVSFVGAYPVNRPMYLHMWMNLDQNNESHFPYTELQPWLRIYTGNTTFFSYYMWADGCRWEDSLKQLKDRNLITTR